MFELALIILIYIFFVAYWRLRQAAHERRLRAYKVRIHVNGIRGKSTVTRLIAGALREGGYRTLAKTTGSAAVTIDFDGRDIPIPRRGAANVKEQQDIIAGWEPLGAEAMVIECMALQPQYQEWTENMVLQAHIGVITNVREDHQDVMGETLPEIAVSLARMCPRSGYLITAEYDPELQAILRREAERRGSQLVVADPNRVRDEDIARFDYMAFKDNVAVGLAVADLLGIDAGRAMRGMVNAKSDIGAVRLQRVAILDKPVIWANLFAVNDRESMIISMDVLDAYCHERTVKIGLLNNRYDRERRAEQFSDVAVKDLPFDWLITFGAFEDLVTRKLLANGFPADRIVNLGFSVNPSLEQILAAIADMIPEGHEGLLVGFVNIHTPQAEMMMDYFARLEELAAVETAVSPNTGYSRRRQFEMAHWSGAHA
ncbi:MAG: poly-gamma-glutamate synthase PgsB [Anaerolineae bacterium]